MKLNKYIGLAAMAVAFSACQQDMLEGENMQNGIYTLSGNMAGGAAMSRAQVVLGNTDGSKESFMWNDGDAFALYQNMEAHVFTISSNYNEISSENKKAASFTTTNPASAARYVAIYPADVVVEDDNSAKFELQNVINFTNADTQAKQNGVWRSYLMKNMFMMAKGTLQDGVTNVVNFEHLCAMARITYTNTTDEAQSIGSIRLGGEQNITTSMSYYIPNEYQNGSGSTNWYTVNTTGLTVAAGATTDFYIMFFPSGFGTRLDIVLNINSMEKAVSLDIADVVEANTGDEGFEAGKRYWFKLTGYKDRLIWSKDFTTNVVTIENPQLALALKDVLAEQDIEVELDANTGYGKISEMDALSVRNLYFDWGRYKLTTLDGIEHFKNLNYLYCNGSKLQEADLSQNTALETLYVGYNNLTALDLTNNVNLKRLQFSGNSELATAKIEQCVNLESLYFEDVPLKSLQISSSAKSKIYELAYSYTEIPVDLNEYPKLTLIYSNGLGLKNLNHIPSAIKKQLVNISVDDNALESLDMSEFPNLGTLRCNNNKLTSLDLTPVPSLKFLECTGNKIKKLDIKPLTGLLSLNCGNQQDNILLELILTDAQKGAWNASWKEDWGNENVYLEGEFSTKEITFTNKELAAALYKELGSEKVTMNADGTAVMLEGNVLLITELDFGQNEYTITSLAGIEQFVNLQSLTCRETGLKECDFNQNTKLKNVDVFNNELEELYFNNHADLERVFCSGNSNLSVLNVKACGKLSQLACANTALTSVTIAKPEIVTYLIYNNTSLSFDLSKFTNLDCLNVGNHGLTTLDLAPAAKSKITQLLCEGNKLTSINLNEYPNLWSFHCGGNQLKELDLSKANKLEFFSCEYNYIEKLDISNTIIKNPDFTMICGPQQNNIQLVLTLTDVQKAVWKENNWSQWNPNVVLQGEESSGELVTINNAELSTVLYSMFGASKVKLENGNAVMTKSFAESVIELNLYKRSLTSLAGIGVFKNLVVLNCEENALTTLDLSQLPKLKNLNCVSNKLTALDLSYCPELTNLRCSKNQLANISVNHLKNLVELDIIENQLTSLDVSSLTKLKGLYCFKNHLQTLDLSACIALSTMQLGTQTDKDGKDVILKLKLSDASMESWTSKWASDGSNKNVELVTGPSVETGNGNTGGSDFTIEGIY